MFCAKCGKKINDNAFFCNFCGTQVQRNTKTNVSQHQTPFIGPFRSHRYKRELEIAQKKIDELNAMLTPEMRDVYHLNNLKLTLESEIRVLQNKLETDTAVLDAKLSNLHNLFSPAAKNSISFWLLDSFSETKKTTDNTLHSVKGEKYPVCSEIQ
ncbi:zinc ribbon domain-containing protein [Ructibacterium gallinarum]|uniref:Zinc ribbon domain-containing protein n=1 Tax=Ructibacterium gallinarum TaxID=2779355 RepID=A0A9D5M1X7_9FIRM|nr:zinc ribbon domain-containing protein [Ructibacterium gallinarum]MBE5040641.1 zinc ribbon domain-containing protein [Ructibacterium gallinarum]